MRKKSIFLLLISCLLVFSACSGKKEDAEETKETTTSEEEAYEEEVPAVNALDEDQPIPEDTGTLELTEQRFESANLILQLPEGVTAVEGEADDQYGYVTVTDDGGEWKMSFQAFVDDTNLVNNVQQNWYAETHKDGDPEAETEIFSKKTDWSQDVAGTVAGYSARVWANNTAGDPYEANMTQVQAVDIIIDYGEQFVGRYYGLYIRLQMQDPKENDNIYEILYRRAVRAVINNFSVIEDKEMEAVTENGITISFPARWSVTAEKGSIIATTKDDPYKSFVGFVNFSNAAPEEAAASWGEVIPKKYGERDYSCVVYNVGEEDSPRYTVTLYSIYDEEESLLCSFTTTINGASEEELRSYLDDESFVEIMESVEIDPSAYTSTTGAKAEGFKVNYGKLMEYTGTEEEITIPSEINGFVVEEISSSAFMGNTTIKSVEIPDTVTYIEPFAFSECTSLETVILPENITYIGQGTFEECTALKDIVIPAGVTEIGKNAFAGAGTGTFEAMGAAVYGDSCFQMSGFETILLADGSDLSAVDIFRQSAVRTLRLPSDLTTLGDRALYYCDNITELSLPDSVTTLGKECVASMHNLKKLSLPDGITELPENLTYVSGLEYLSIPASVTSIRSGAVDAHYAFLYNTDVELEDGALSVYSIYLDGVYSSENVPDNIENQYIYDRIRIPWDATVEESDALDEYYVSLGMDSISWMGPSEAFCDSNTEDYITEDYWLVSYNGNKSMVYIPLYTEDGTDILWLKSEAFAGNTTIEGISFGGINSINARSFEGCTNLKELWFGSGTLSSLEDDDGSIEDDAFTGIPENVTVYLPGSLTEEERQNYMEAFYAKGMPESAIFETFSFREETEPSDET